MSKLRRQALNLWRRIRRRCGEGCSSGSSIPHEEPTAAYGQEGVYAMTATSSILPGKSSDLFSATAFIEAFQLPLLDTV